MQLIIDGRPADTDTGLYICTGSIPLF